MSGSSAGGALQTLGTLIAPNAMAGLRAQREQTEQKDALSKLFATMGQEPQAAPSGGAFKPLNPVPEMGYPGAPATPMKSLEALPQLSFPGKFNAQDLPQAQRGFDLNQMQLMAKISPQAALEKMFAGPTAHAVPEGGSVVWTDAKGNEVRRINGQPKPADTFKVGATRDIQRGTKKITQEYDGTHWNDLSEGPAWAPNAPPQEPPPVEVDDPTSPTGRRLLPRADALGKPGPASQGPIQSENALRDEFNKNTEAARTVAMQYRNAKKSAAASTAAGDMGLIYSYMKALDPGSSVKEGEYAQGENLTGAYGKFWQNYNKAKDGEKLLPETRADILGRMGDIYQSHVPSFNATKDRYSSIAKNQRLNPANIVTEMPAVDDQSVTKWGRNANGRPVQIK